MAFVTRLTFLYSLIDTPCLSRLLSLLVATARNIRWGLTLWSYSHSVIEGWLRFNSAARIDSTVRADLILGLEDSEYLLVQFRIAIVFHGASWRQWSMISSFQTQETLLSLLFSFRVISLSPFLGLVVLLSVGRAIGNAFPDCLPAANHWVSEPSWIEDSAYSQIYSSWR